MKVLMQARVNLFSCMGGDTIQILKTKEYVEKQGIDVDISTELSPNLNGYDIVHLFNLTRIQETYLQAKNAKKFNKPIIFSTIYWPTDELELKGQLGLRRILNKLIGVNNVEKIKIIAKHFKGEKISGINEIIKRDYKKIQYEILDMCDWFLPNSKLEMDEISKSIGFKTDRFNTVVNAIDPQKIKNINGEKYNNFKNSIVCIGRIEPRKNQLNLVKALYDTDYPLIIVGKQAPNHSKYYNLVREHANSNTKFIDYLENDDVYDLCTNAKVHVLPSWYETPGLVSLEAGVCGCNIVVSDRGSTRDYFKDMADYCEPDNIESIKNAVLNAMYRDKNDILKNFIMDNYKWDKAAEQTIYGYRKVLNLE